MPAIPANDVHADLTSIYIQKAMKCPILSFEEEQRLSILWKEHRDVRARDTVINSHLRVAVKMARRFSSYGIPMEDLISEGALGLSKAMDKFEPEKGFRFSTYAGWWVKAAVMDYILRTAYQTPMGTTTASKKLFFSLRRVKAKLGIVDDIGLTPDQAQQIATATGTSTGDVVLMDRRMRSDVSLNNVLNEDGAEMIDTLEDDSPLPDQVYIDQQERGIRNALLAKALDVLNEREQHVIKARRLTEPCMTLEELATVYGVSRERIRQIEVKALQRLEKRILHLAGQRRYLPMAA